MQNRLALFPQTVDAQRACSSSSEIEEYETVNHGQLTMILQGPKSVGSVGHEIGEGHFPRQDEGRRPRQEPNKNKRAAHEFQNGGQTHQRQEVQVLRLGGWIPEQFLTAVGHEKKAHDDPHQGKQERRDLATKSILVSHNGTNLGRST
jgi:hypothetical protein